MENSSLSRVWFITGTSTGFGRLLAEELLKRGERVIATARNVSTSSDVALRDLITAPSIAALGFASREKALATI